MSRINKSVRRLALAAVLTSGVVAASPIVSAQDSGVRMTFNDNDTSTSAQRAEKARLPRMSGSTVFRWLMKGSGVGVAPTTPPVAPESVQATIVKPSPGNDVKAPETKQQMTGGGVPNPDRAVASTSAPSTADHAMIETSSGPMGQIPELASVIPFRPRKSVVMPEPLVVPQSNQVATSLPQATNFVKRQMITNSDYVESEEKTLSQLITAASLQEPAPEAVPDAGNAIPIPHLETGLISAEYETPEGIEPLTEQSALFGALWGADYGKEAGERYLAQAGSFPLAPAVRVVKDEGYGDRLITGSVYTWAAPSLYHHPLYFEQVNLERYGQGPAECLQPAFSAAQFFWTIPQIPYQLGAAPPSEKVYVLGHWRPGNRAPYQWHRVRPSTRGLIYQALATGGLVAVVP